MVTRNEWPCDHDFAANTNINFSHYMCV